MRVSIDKNQLNETLVMLKGLELEGPKILSRSLNAAATFGRKRANQEIRKQVRLKSPYINKKLKIKRATWSNLSARITAEKRGVLMTRFPHTVLKRGGVTVGIKAGGKRKKLPGAFKTRVKAGDDYVDVIAIPAPGFFTTGNPKFKVLYAPSVSQVFNTVRDDIDSEVMEFLDIDVEKQILKTLRGY